ncbi:IclR family transcriptional regulator [Microvirga lotononidis]|uniref:Transcriptional regulator n=1 Tax=Microvirga lotononidis TaxID=864069 RepID=I4YY02_9HYPH|nr:IclR family transcriptional regulator [Microvirga lotononidis]EIM28844.1 transcriptional regulator [Microvirga lotononidis]WQO25429.1 IclR family transcriptional regulator [Microvirga lotononidis]
MSIEGRGVQSVEVGGRILAAMVKAGKPLMLRELATLADVAPAQAHAYLVSFRKLELVEQDAASGRYQLGPFALQLGIARLRSFDPLRLAAQAVVEFAEEVGLMVTIAVWGTHGATIVQVQEGSDQVHVNVRTGTVFSITGTATGKVFAAFMPPKIIEAHLAEELRKGARIQGVGASTSRKELEAEVATARRLGYATTESKPVTGINGIAAPVFDYSGQMQLAITLIGPTGVLDIGPKSADAKALLAFTRKLSAQLGYAPHADAEASSDEGAEIVAAPVAKRRRRA